MERDGIKRKRRWRGVGRTKGAGLCTIGDSTGVSALIVCFLFALSFRACAPLSAKTEGTAVPDSGSAAAPSKEAGLSSAAGSFFGWIPVQYATAGVESSLDLKRFLAVGSQGSLRVENGPDYRASIDTMNGVLHLTPSKYRQGLLEIPLIFENGGEEKRTVIEFVVVRRAAHRFRYEPGHKIDRAVVAGSFNGWNQGATVLEDPDGDGIYEAVVFLDPGTYPYKFVVDGKWIPDPRNPDKVPDGFGGFNSVFTVKGGPAGPPPSLFAAFRNENEVAVRLIPGSSPVTDVSVVEEGREGTVRRIDFERVEQGIRIPLENLDTASWVRVTAVDAAGRVGNVVRFPVTDSPRFEWKDAIVYFAFTDRFSNGKKENDRPVPDSRVLPPANFHGGDFEGIRRKIEEGYFDELGINTLWISPVNRNPDGAYREYLAPYRYYTGYHGYWPVSPTEVDPRFGTLEELRSLVETAHRHGIRVIADLVLNHVHKEHPWWKKHRDWFGRLELPDGTRNLRRFDEYPFTTWFEPFLPSFDFGNPNAVAALLRNTRYWLEETDLDGFRLDAVKHIPREFWNRFREYLRATVERPRGRRLFLIGETFLDRAGIASYVGPNRLDGQFDFPLYDALVSTFAMRKTGFNHLEKALEESERVYGKESTMAPLLGNHDKARFMAYADGDLPDPTESDEEEVGWKRPPRVDHDTAYGRLKQAFVFLMSIDGAPTIYYGDEIGMTGAGDPDNRRDMRFGSAVKPEEEGVKETVASVARARRKHPALRYGSRRPIMVTKDFYAFVRAWFEDRALAAFNRTEKPETISVENVPELPNGVYRDAVSGRVVELKEGGRFVEVPAGSAVLLVRE
ncbi:MAG: hypothetical protein D6679_07780 [Candidatus Hydrogenedentota bacterium]|nr:MAG: hypothetical protein D6679_07780 [Candidatus Hydrogenedentota bacterium]